MVDGTPLETPGEGVADERGRRPATIETEKLLVDPAAGPAAGDGVRDRREPAAPLRQRADASDHAGPQRHPVPLPVAGEELALEARHVHANGALGLARAAFEAQVEHVVDVVV